MKMTVAGTHLFGRALLLSCALLAPAVQAQTPKFVPQATVGIYHAVGRVAVAPNGSLFAVTCDETVKVYETKQSRERFRLPHSMLLSDAAFSPDGKRLLITKNKLPVVVETETGKTVCTLETTPFRNSGKLVVSFPAARPFCATFSPDGQTVAMSCGGLYHMFLDLYDAQTGKRTRELLNDVDGVALQIVFSPDGKVVADNQGGLTFLVDTATGKEVKRLRGDIKRLWFPLAGRDALFYYLSGGRVSMDYPRTAGMSRRLFPMLPGALSPEWRAVNAGSSGRVATIEGESIVLRDLEGAEVGQMDGSKRGKVTCLAFSMDGRLAVVGRSNGLTDVWQLGQ